MTSYMSLADVSLGPVSDKGIMYEEEQVARREGILELSLVL